MVKKIRKMGVFEIILYITALIFLGYFISYEWHIYQEIRQHNQEIKLNWGQQ